METLRLVLIFLHILGWAALFGGLVVQASESPKRVNGAMRDGVGTAFLTGLALVGVIQGADLDEVDNAKIAVKAVVGLVLLVLVMANTRKERIPQGLWAGLLALTVVNIAVAVFWSSAHV
jgi:FtsH-binding integral membrane protein